MSSNPLISVIIPVRNGAKYLAEAVNSVRAQDYSPLEIIVVDDGSTDDSAAVARSLGDDVRVFTQPPSGPSAARNRGLRESSGELIALLDGDDMFPANKLRIQSARMLADPTLDIVNGYVQMIAMLGAEGVVTHAPIFRRNTPYIEIHLGSALYRRSLFFDRVGLFDETLPFSEDADWFLRAEEANAKMVILRTITLYYRRHPANVTLTTTPQAIRNYYMRALRHASERRGKEVTPADFPRWSGYVDPLPTDQPRPLVSVIIPVYNQARYLGQALDSVLAQNYEPLEIIVVDDGSTDNLAEIIRQYPAVQFPAIRFVRQEHAGAASARNYGLTLAHGDLIAFLDSDDTWLPDKLNRQVDHLVENPYLYTLFSLAQFYLDPGTTKPDWLKDDSLIYPFIATIPSALLARREAFAQAGQFDPQYPSAHDADWFTRAQDANVPYDILLETLVRCRVHEAGALTANSAQRLREITQIYRASIKRRQHEVK